MLNGLGAPLFRTRYDAVHLFLFGRYTTAARHVNIFEQKRLIVEHALSILLVHDARGCGLDNPTVGQSSPPIEGSASISCAD